LFFNIASIIPGSKLCIVVSRWLLISRWFVAQKKSVWLNDFRSPNWRGLGIFPAEFDWIDLNAVKIGLSDDI